MRLCVSLSFIPFPHDGELIMAKRGRMGRKASRKTFTRGAMRVHPKNRRDRIMRGGTRL